MPAFAVWAGEGACLVAALAYFLLGLVGTQWKAIKPFCFSFVLMKTGNWMQRLLTVDRVMMFPLQEFKTTKENIDARR